MTKNCRLILRKDDNPEIPLNIQQQQISGDFFFMRHQNQLQNISMLSEGIFAITFVKIKEHYEFLIHKKVRVFRKKIIFVKLLKLLYY